MEYYQKYLEYINKFNHFMIYNGITITKVEKDLSEAELVVGPNSLNPLGTIHGGLYFTMADCAASAAARSDGLNYVTLGSSFDYIRSAGSGTVRAVAEVRHRGKTVCRVAARVVDDSGRVLAEGNFTMYCLHKPFVMDF